APLHKHAVELDQGTCYHSPLDYERGHVESSRRVYSGQDQEQTCKDQCQEKPFASHCTFILCQIFICGFLSYSHRSWMEFILPQRSGNQEGERASRNLCFLPFQGFLRMLFAHDFDANPSMRVAVCLSEWHERKTPLACVVVCIPGCAVASDASLPSFISA